MGMPRPCPSPRASLYWEGYIINIYNIYKFGVVVGDGYTINNVLYFSRVYGEPHRVGPTLILIRSTMCAPSVLRPAKDAEIYTHKELAPLRVLQPSTATAPQAALVATSAPLTNHTHPADARSGASVLPSPLYIYLRELCTCCCIWGPPSFGSFDQRQCWSRLASLEARTRNTMALPSFHIVLSRFFLPELRTGCSRTSQQQQTYHTVATAFATVHNVIIY